MIQVICGISSIVSFLIAIILYFKLKDIERKYTESSTKKEKTFKIKIGEEEKTLSYSELENLSKEEKDKIFKVAEGCTSLSTVDVEAWDVSNCTELKVLSKMNNEQIEYCQKNGLVSNYPIIGLAALIDAEIKDMFNNLGKKNDEK